MFRNSDTRTQLRGNRRLYHHYCRTWPTAWCRISPVQCVPLDVVSLLVVKRPTPSRLSLCWHKPSMVPNLCHWITHPSYTLHFFSLVFRLCAPATLLFLKTTHADKVFKDPSGFCTTETACFRKDKGVSWNCYSGNLKIPHFCWTSRFITVFTKVRHS
jgi:hypothetical protein